MLSCPQCACACDVGGLLSAALGSADTFTSGTFIACSSGCQFLSDKLEPFQRRVTRTKKGLKIMSGQEVLNQNVLAWGREYYVQDLIVVFTYVKQEIDFGACVSRVEELS